MRRRLDPLAEHWMRLPRTEALSKLREDMLRAAYIKCNFVLTTGLRWSYYFDKHLCEARLAILRRLTRYLADLVPRDTDRMAARYSAPWPSGPPSRWNSACHS